MDDEEEKKEGFPSKAQAIMALKKTSSSNKVLFNNLNSKIVIATVMSYLLTWRQAPKFFNCLSKLGAEYFQRHK